MTIILWILLILFVIIPAITFAPEGGTPPFFILIAKLTVDQSGKKKEKNTSLYAQNLLYTLLITVAMRNLMKKPYPN